MSTPLLEVENLVKDYALPREKLLQAPGKVHALQGVSFTIEAGRSLGIVGESGSGKSTLARLVMALDHPTSGRVRLLGRDLHALPREELRVARRDFQMVFQDPYGSLDPRQTVERIVTEPLSAQGGITREEQHGRASEVLQAVGLRANDLRKYPHEFSGGQRQRIAIARCLTMQPEIIVCDESVSALDVSVQATVLNLLLDLQEEFGLTYVFISHDLAVVKYMADDILVMSNGEIVERGASDEIYRNPKHPYTQQLLAAIPRGDVHGAAAAVVPA